MLPVIGELTHIKFDVSGNSHCLLPSEAYGFVAGLQISANKTALQFEEVVATRSIILLKPDQKIRHLQTVWINKGPFTTEQFLRMIHFETGISNDEWFKHMTDSARVSVSSTPKKKQSALTNKRKGLEGRGAAKRPHPGMGREAEPNAHSSPRPLRQSRIAAQESAPMARDEGLCCAHPSDEHAIGPIEPDLRSLS